MRLQGALSHPWRDAWHEFRGDNLKASRIVNWTVRMAEAEREADHFNENLVGEV